MKTAILKRSRPARARSGFLQPWVAVGLLLLSLTWAANLFAQPTVTTLGGGIKGKAGYKDANTFSAALFDFPCGLALDPSGTALLVADYTNNAVRWISNLGNNSTSWTYTFVNSTNGISRPVAVLVDAATNVYVLNQGSGANGSLLEFTGCYFAQTQYKALVATFASNLHNATAMALDGLGNIYLTCNNNNVRRINLVTNELVGVITNAGTSLQGIAIRDDGRLALSDAGNNGIWVMNPYSASISNNAYKFTGFHGAGDVTGPSNAAAFYHPENIARADGGMLLVADRFNHKVKLVDAAGEVSRFFGVSTNFHGTNLWISPAVPYPGWYDGTVNANEAIDPVEAREPFGLVVGANGTVYDTEVYYHIIRQATGATLSNTNKFPIVLPPLPPLFSGPMGLALDSSSSFMFIADQTNNAVLVLDFSDNQTTSFLGASDGLSLPVDVALDSSDDVYVLNRGTNGHGYIMEFDAWQNPLGTIATGLTNPTAMTFDGSGNLFVAEQSGAVQVFNPNVFPVYSNTVVTIATTNVQLQGIAIMDSGAIAVSDAGSHVIWQINPLTRAVTRLTGQTNVPGTTFGGPSFAKLNQPHKLARAAGNRLVVADYGNSRLVAVECVAGYSGYITNKAILNSTNSLVWFGVSGDPFGTNNGQWVRMALPVAVAVGADGVYSAEPTNKCIRELLSAGLAQAGPPPSVLPFFDRPMGIALDAGSANLYIADQPNNAVQVLAFSDNLTTTYLDETSGVDQPVDVALDASDNLFVLNQGTAGNGFILEFDRFGNLLATNATGLVMPTAFMMDGSGDFYVTEQIGTNSLVQEFGPGITNLNAIVITNAQLQGIARFDDGVIAVSDATNHVIWQINWVTKSVSLLTGHWGVPGTTLGASNFAKLFSPRHLARAANNLLVAADYGNNRLVVVDRVGSITNVLNSTNSFVWFGRPGDPAGNTGTNSALWVPMKSPVGVAVGTGGAVYSSEILYNDIRELLNTGLSQPGSVNGTNYIAPPMFGPDSGYFPMGQTISVSSTYTNVHYTTDGSEPTTNSPAVVNNSGYLFIRWFNSTNDLTGLRVKAFVGTNASDTVIGQPAQR